MPPKKSRRGAAAITLHHVAGVAGVSPMTVSRVIGGVQSVSQEMRERVEAAIARTGYAPNTAAQKLASGGTTRIGVLYGNPSARFTSAMLIGLVEASRRLGCQLILKKCQTPGQAAAHAEALGQAQVHGVVLPTPLCDDARATTAIAPASRPRTSCSLARIVLRRSLPATTRWPPERSLRHTTGVSRCRTS